MAGDRRTLTRPRTPGTARTLLARLRRRRSAASWRGAVAERRLDAVEDQLRHLEAVVEGLQDAVHRRSQLDDVRNDELLRRTGSHSDPGDDARKRRV